MGYRYPLHSIPPTHCPALLCTLAALAAVRDKAVKFIEEHPVLATVGAVVLIVVGGIVVINAVEALLLLAAGFGPLRPVKGASSFYSDIMCEFSQQTLWECSDFGTVAAVRFLRRQH